MALYTMLSTSPSNYEIVVTMPKPLLLPILLYLSNLRKDIIFPLSKDRRVTPADPTERCVRLRPSFSNSLNLPGCKHRATRAWDFRNEDLWQGRQEILDERDTSDWCMRYEMQTLRCARMEMFTKISSN